MVWQFWFIFYLFLQIKNQSTSEPFKTWLDSRGVRGTMHCTPEFGNLMGYWELFVTKDFHRVQSLQDGSTMVYSRQVLIYWPVDQINMGLTIVCSIDLTLRVQPAGIFSGQKIIENYIASTLTIQKIIKKLHCKYSYQSKCTLSWALWATISIWIKTKRKKFE